ncbi:AMP-binding protein [Pseudoalteromonas piscicida]|uniref:AMP-binding protein n=1 Tax=Pseudoalteromonas piscicida TaxID=43662 RepID=UPI000E358BD1|nr:AMP-binding protein [Pseudoalteromonas piscicida]AXQ99547.1 hypothetical protein D0N37_18700 [Pseudoalteromonas piscicida]
MKNAIPISVTNDRSVDISGFGNLADLFSFNMKRYSKEVAVIDKGLEYTYEDLEKMVDRIALNITKLGIKKNDCIAINLKPSFDMVASLNAAMKLGCRFVLLDQNNTKLRNEAILSDSNACILVCDDEYNLVFPGHSFNIKSELSDNELSPHSYPEVQPDDTAYMVYTSGTTGSPKGVLIGHRGIMSYLQAALAQYYHNQLRGALLVASPSFDMGITSILIPLCVGHKVVIMDMASITIRAGRYLNSEQSGNLLIRITPTGMKSILLASGKKVSNNSHTFVIGGENFAVPLAEQISNVFPNATIWNHYGPTECVVGCTLYHYQKDMITDARNLPCGAQMHNSIVLILNADTQMQMEHGEVGEIYVGKDALSQGYYNNPSLTNKSFIETPFDAMSSKAPVLYKTGDLGFINELGELVFCGRIDNQSKINGYRFEMEEIESAIVASRLVSAAVVVNKDGTSKHLTAFVQPFKCKGLPHQKLVSYLEQCLPKYAIPGQFIAVHEWPTTSNGKIDRKVLSEGEPLLC